MSFQSKIELVTRLLTRIDVLQASLRITFHVGGVLDCISENKDLEHSPDDHTVLLDLPVPTILQNGAVKLVLTQLSGRTEDTSLIAAIARGTYWFEQLTSGKASSVLSIACREKVSESYVSRLLNLALLDPDLVELVLEGDPSAKRDARDRGRRYIWKAPTP